ncbi:MAG: iron ABC transporter permease, partial [Bacteroidia bacterium]|nr:iron ABC transporter permease [Bacteroidia bacterium]
MKNYSKAYYILIISFVVLFIGNLVYGSINIPIKDVINILFGSGSEKS